MNSLVNISFPLRHARRYSGSLRPCGRLWLVPSACDSRPLRLRAAARRFFRHASDHLSDPAHLPGRKPRGGWSHGFLGSWDEDDMQFWLRFNASDEEHAKHAKEFPKDKLSPKETAFRNCDWRLPKGPF